MKSYFARLAARVAPPRETARPSVNAVKLHDPFEESGSPETQAPPQSSPPMQATSATPSRRSIAPVHNHEQVGAPLGTERSETVSARAENPPEVSALTPKPATAGEMGTVEDVASKSLVRRIDQNTRLTPKPSNSNPSDDVRATDAHEARPPAFESLKKSSAESPEEAADSRRANPAGDTESSEAILLHKADAFMKGLFERQASNDRAARTNAMSVPPVAEPLHPPVEAAQRLAPVPVVRPAPKQEREQPSLVIGQLTVEVAPQAPVAPAKAERIIVKQSSGRVSGGIPSSRRFGLSQF